MSFFLSSERRAATRFEFKEALPAAIECVNKPAASAIRLTGELVDMSATGAFVRVSREQAEQYRVGAEIGLSFVKRDPMRQEDFDRLGINPPANERHLFYVDQHFPRQRWANGRLVCDGHPFTGVIARVTPRGYGVRFNAPLPDHYLSSFFQTAVGLVEEKPHAVFIKGGINDSTKRQILRFVRNPKSRVVDLSQATHIDAVGAGQILVAQDAGMHIRNCSEAIKPVLLASGSCLKCSAGCTESLIAKHRKRA